MRPRHLYDVAVASAPPGRGGFRAVGAELDREGLLLRVAELADWVSDISPPGSRVAVAARRPDRRTMSCLAVAAADRTLVPVDAGWPRDRLEQAFAEAGVAAFVFDETVADEDERLPAGRGSAGPDGFLAASYPRPATDADEQYVMFTSGSTGRPKAVRVLPGAALAHARAAVDWLRLTPDDVVYQFARLSFDTSQEQIWPSLMAGATIAAPSTVDLTFRTVARDVADHGVTVLDVPTAFWRAWGAVIQGKDLSLPTLRLVSIGGEAAYWHDVATWRRGPLSGVQLVNAYGPTEAGITAMAYSVPTTTVDSTEGLPIGWPLGARVVHLEPYDGGRSELWLTGDALAAGYLRPVVPDPFTSLDGVPCYRTGDLVTTAPDGALVFAGRRDREVKVRGHRVSIDDVEAAIGAVEGVAEALVLVVETAAERFLVAVVATVYAMDPAAVRDALALDAPAVPRHFVELPELPRNTSGKVDVPAVQRQLWQQRPEWAPDDEGRTQ